MRLIARFCDAFPGVVIEFTLYDWTSSMRLLHARTVDVGVITAPRNSAEFLELEIDRVRYVLYTRADHPFARRRSVRLAEVSRERVILPEEGSLTPRVFSRALAQHGCQMQRSIRITTFPVMKDAILQGIGVGPLLEKSTSSEDGLCALPIDEMQDTYPISVVAHRERAKLHLIKNFLSIARAPW